MNGFKKISAFIQITRPINVLITFFTVIVAILISPSHHLDLYIIFYAAIAAAFTAASGNIINDIYDVETDRIAHPDRMITKGRLSKKESWIIYSILNLLAIIISIMISNEIFVLVILSIISLLFYSLYLKKIPLAGNILVSLLTALTFIYGGVVAGNLSSVFIPAAFAFLINLIREIIKDIQDMSGDAKIGIRTFPVVFGVYRSKIIIVSLSIMFIGLTIYPFIILKYKIEYFIIVMIFVNPVIVIVLKLLFSKNLGSHLNNISNLLKLNMVAGLIAIYLGK